MDDLKHLCWRGTSRTRYAAADRVSQQPKRTRVTLSTSDLIPIGRFAPYGTGQWRAIYPEQGTYVRIIRTIQGYGHICPCFRTGKPWECTSVRAMRSSFVVVGGPLLAGRLLLVESWQWRAIEVAILKAHNFLGALVKP